VLPLKQDGVVVMYKGFIKNNIPEEIRKKILLSQLKQFMKEEKIDDYRVVNEKYIYGVVDCDNKVIDINKGHFVVEFNVGG